MNYKIIMSVIFAFFIIAGFLLGQEKEWEKLELPQKTLDYKINRALINQVGNIMLGIAYAKTKGESPEDFAAYGLKCWGSWWKDKDYSYYVTKWNNVFSTDKDFKTEILSETKDMIDLKMNIFGERYIATYAESGVTKEEYIRYLGALLSSMAEYMGFEHKLKIEGDGIYLSVAKK